MKPKPERTAITIMNRKHGISTLVMLVGIVIVSVTIRAYTQAQGQAQAQAQSKPAPAATTPAPAPLVNPPASQASPATTAKPVPAKPAPVPSCAPPAYCPTEAQALRIENLQLRARLAETAYVQRSQQLPEFTQYTSAVSVLAGECGKIRDENKWPRTVECDIRVDPVTFKDQGAAGAGVGAAGAAAGAPK